MHYRFVTTLLLVSSLSSTAVALTPTSESVERIDVGTQLHSWQPLDSQNLVLSLGSARRYLLTLTAGCLRLPYANHLAISTSGRRIYAGFDYVTAGRQKCTIDSIHRLVAAPDEQQPPIPAAGE